MTKALDTSNELDMKNLLLFLVTPILWGCAAQPPEPPLEPTLILISLDGFRADYLDRSEAPALKALSDRGFRAKSLKPVFPTVTFVNHYTQVTGLYPENSGIVANDMWDPVTKVRFQISKPEIVDQSEWWQGEPIWVTAQKQGLLTATMFWVGSNAKIQGRQADYWEKYDSKFPLKERVAKVFSWLDLPRERRPRIITLYMSDVDEAGHSSGPDSKTTSEAIKRVDSAIQTLIDGVQTRGWQDQIDIMVVSDHGMTALSPDRVIRLKDLVKEDAEIIGGGTIAGLWPKPGREKSLYQRLRKVKNMKTYRKSEIPERYHYRNHRRIPPLQLIADEGWYLAKAEETPSATSGLHGYDNDLASMQGILVAAGPHFITATGVGVVESIDLYEMMCELVKIKPAKNDGNLSRVRPLLRKTITGNQ